MEWYDTIYMLCVPVTVCLWRIACLCGVVSSGMGEFGVSWIGLGIERAKFEFNKTKGRKERKDLSKLAKEEDSRTKTPFGIYSVTLHQFATVATVDCCCWIGGRIGWRLAFGFFSLTAIRLRPLQPTATPERQTTHYYNITPIHTHHPPLCRVHRHPQTVVPQARVRIRWRADVPLHITERRCLKAILMCHSTHTNIHRHKHQPRRPQRIHSHKVVPSPIMAVQSQPPPPPPPPRLTHSHTLLLPLLRRRNRRILWPTVARLHIHRHPQPVRSHA